MLRAMAMPVLAAAWAALAVSAPVQAEVKAEGHPGDARHGAELYEQRCAACHSPAADRVGPRHNGVLGRRAGSVPGYAYSPALAQAGFAWSPAKLDAWLANPEQLVPGQRMGYSVSVEGDRADLIAYLSTLTPQ